MALPQDIQQSVQNQSAKVLVTGQRFTRFDQVRQRHFWSTYRFKPDANGFLRSGDFDLFSIPAGQMGQGFSRQLTLKETNWPSANRVPDNQNFEITEIGCTATQSVADPDAQIEGPFSYQDNNYPAAGALVLDNTSLGITYLTNTVPLGLCSDFAQAAGPQQGYYAPSAPQVYPLLAGTETRNRADGTRNFFTNGFAAPALRRRFKIPILLQHGETFKFTLSISPGRGPFLTPPVAQYDPDSWPNYVVDVRMDFWATESFVEQA